MAGASRARKNAGRTERAASNKVSCINAYKARAAISGTCAAGYAIWEAAINSIAAGGSFQTGLFYSEA